jgi:glucose-6-phosphate 1-epimerase
MAAPAHAAAAGGGGDGATQQGRGGLPKVVARHAASGAVLEVYTHGATVTSWVPRPGGPDVLFVSSAAVWDGVKAVRGGIPLAFPQFAAQGPLPMHGFARVSTWAVDTVVDGGVTLTLADSAATRALWPHAFRLVYRVTFSGEALSTTLEVHHAPDTPADAPPLVFEALLHSYFGVGEGGVGAGGVRVAGLAGVTYLDKPAGGATVVEASDAFELLGEVDRIYKDAPGDVSVTGLRQPGGPSALTIRRRAAVRDEAPALKQVVEHAPLDVVVWNAGPAKCASIADFGPEDWRSYVCVEPGRVSDKVTLPPRRVWSIMQTVTPTWA